MFFPFHTDVGEFRLTSPRTTALLPSLLGAGCARLPCLSAHGGRVHFSEDKPSKGPILDTWCGAAAGGSTTDTCWRVQSTPTCG